MSRYDGLNVIKVTPTLDANALATGDLMCGIATIPNVFAVGGAMLHSIVVKDKAAQSGAFDIVFLDAATLPGSTLTLNAAFNPVDADLDSVIGHVSITSTDYATAWTGNALATKSGIGLILTQPTSTPNLYFVLVSKDSKTYAASSLIFAFGFLRD